MAIVGRAIILERKPSKKKQRTDIIKDAKAGKRIKSDNREKSNMACHHNYFVFWWY